MFKTSVNLLIEPFVGLEIEDNSWGVDADSFVIDHIKHSTSTGIIQMQANETFNLNHLSEAEFDEAIANRMKDSRANWTYEEYPFQRLDE